MPEIINPQTIGVGIVLILLVVLVIRRIRRPSGKEVLTKPSYEVDRTDIYQQQRKLERDENEKILDNPSPDVSDVNMELERLRREANARRNLGSK